TWAGVFTPATDHMPVGEQRDVQLRSTWAGVFTPATALRRSTGVPVLAAPLNVGRGLHPGDGRRGGGRSKRGSRRSTWAGVFTPATAATDRRTREGPARSTWAGVFTPATARRTRQPSHMRPRSAQRGPGSSPRRRGRAEVSRSQHAGRRSTWA